LVTKKHFFFVVKGGKKKEEKKQEEWKGHINEIEDAFRKESTFIKKNATENVETIVKEVKGATNISSKEEFQSFLSEQMKLASLCLSELTAGYRQGRDEELNRVMNEYFPDLDNGSKNTSGVDIDNLGDQIVEKAEALQEKTWENINRVFDNGGGDSSKNEDKIRTKQNMHDRHNGGNRHE